MSTNLNCLTADSSRIAALESAIKHGSVTLSFWGGMVWLQRDGQTHTFRSMRDALSSLAPASDSSCVSPPSGNTTMGESITDSPYFFPKGDRNA